MSDRHNGTTIVTRTPLHTLDWYIKWFSSIVLMVGILLTANNIYPLNLYFHFVGIGGWLIVGILWNDRSLIVVNTFAIATLLSNLFRLHLS
jgi:energy-coupling factor transporter transmembrane protein EcfT